MSYIICDSENVKDACINWLSNMQSRKIKRRNQIIEKLAETRLWNFKKIGIETAEDLLYSGKAGMKYQIPFDVNEFNVSKKEEDVFNLLTIAEKGNPVYITDNHAFIFED